MIRFCGCSLLAAPHSPNDHAQPSGKPARRQVMVAGKRIKTVDIHAHCCVPKAMAVIGHPLEAPALLMDDSANALSTRLAAMDAQGLDVEALSINPFWYKAGRDESAELIRIQNEALVEFCAATPDRFVAFATAALQHPELAAEQVEHVVKKLGFRGVGVGGSGLLTNTIGNPLETTIALSHLIFEGTLDRFPGLKICAAHGGGFLPSYANRSDAVIRTFPNRVGPLPKKKPTQYLRDGQLFFDTIVFTPEALRHLIAETGAGQIVIGTDYPFPWTSTEVDLVLSTPGLSDDERIAILGGTASRLLGIKP